MPKHATTNPAAPLCVAVDSHPSNMPGQPGIEFNVRPHAEPQTS